VTPLGPSEISARRRPGVVLLLAALRLLAGFCLAFPLASITLSSGVGLRADGDRALFEAGGYLLLEVLRLQGPSLGAALTGLAPLACVALAFTAACNVGLLVALSSSGRLQLREWFSRALVCLPGAFLLGAGAGLAQIILLGIGASLAAGLPDSMAKPLASSLGPALIWLVAATLAGALGGFCDLAKACLVRHEIRVGEAWKYATALVLRRPFRACFGWLPYAFVLAIAVAAAGLLTERLDVSRAGAFRVACVFALHQGVVVLAVALRAGWFAAALRLSAAAR
jgi:hypothetical protein